MRNFKIGFIFSTLFLAGVALAESFVPPEQGTGPGQLPQGPGFPGHTAPPQLPPGPGFPGHTHPGQTRPRAGTHQAKVIGKHITNMPFQILNLRLVTKPNWFGKKMVYRRPDHFNSKYDFHYFYINNERTFQTVFGTFTGVRIDFKKDMVYVFSLGKSSFVYQFLRVEDVNHQVERTVHWQDRGILRSTKFKYWDNFGRIVLKRSLRPTSPFNSKIIVLRIPRAGLNGVRPFQIMYVPKANRRPIFNQPNLGPPQVPLSNFPHDAPRVIPGQ